jgi:NAD(P)-dependent dehydrogenase (short-subunit alcohol dehydrogenase family)
MAEPVHTAGTDETRSTAMSTAHQPVGIITGGSQGLGLALTRELTARGWRIVTDARHGDDLADAVAGIDDAVGIVGDVADPAHRRALVAEAERQGGLDLLVNNASTLGPTPLRRLDELTPDDLRQVVETNLVAPLALTQEALPLLDAAKGTILNVSSDAAVEGYEGWGGYGASKAALEQLSRVLANERPHLRVLWVDPGDMRTQMHQDAFPGEDISDRPPPEDSVPGLAALIEGDAPSGRYQAREVAVS